MDVREDTAGGDGHARQQLAELLVVADGELDVARNDAGLLVVAGGVPGELEELGGEVLKHGGEVHRGAGTDAAGVLAGLEVAGDAPDRELEARLRGARDGLLARLALRTRSRGSREGAGVSAGSVSNLRKNKFSENLPQAPRCG